MHFCCGSARHVSIGPKWGNEKTFRRGLTALDHTGVAGAERILAFRETTEESQGIFALGNLGDWSRKSLGKREGEKERYSREYKTHF